MKHVPGATHAALDALIPQRQLGLIFPVGVADTTPYEFYRMIPDGVMLVSVSMGLQEFSAGDVQRVMAALDQHVLALRERGAGLIVHAGVPVSILLGPQRHAELLEDVGRRAGVTIVATLQCVVAAACFLGIRKLAIVNKWDAGMNEVLRAWFARHGIESSATCAIAMAPQEFLRMKNADGLELAYRLAREALLADPAADGLYIGGGSWLTAPLVAVLEREFGRPVITNTTAFVWRARELLGHTVPVTGYGRLLQPAG